MIVVPSMQLNALLVSQSRLSQGGSVMVTCNPLTSSTNLQVLKEWHQHCKKTRVVLMELG